MSAHEYSPQLAKRRKSRVEGAYIRSCSTSGRRSRSRQISARTLALCLCLSSQVAATSTAVQSAPLPPIETGHFMPPIESGGSSPLEAGSTNPAPDISAASFATAGPRPENMGGIMSIAAPMIVHPENPEGSLSGPDFAPEPTPDPFTERPSFLPMFAHTEDALFPASPEEEVPRMTIFKARPEISQPGLDPAEPTAMPALQGEPDPSGGIGDAIAGILGSWQGLQAAHVEDPAPAGQLEVAAAPKPAGAAAGANINAIIPTVNIPAPAAGPSDFALPPSQNSQGRPRPPQNGAPALPAMAEEPAAPILITTTALPPITLFGQTITPAPASPTEYVIAPGTTLKPGGPPVTISGTKIELKPTAAPGGGSGAGSAIDGAGAVLVVGGKSSSLLTPTRTLAWITPTAGLAGSGRVGGKGGATPGDNLGSGLATKTGTGAGLIGSGKGVPTPTGDAGARNGTNGQASETGKSKKGAASRVEWSCGWGGAALVAGLAVVGWL